MIRRKMGFSGRVLTAALFLACGAVSVDAYTIVMRDGRRVEIPNNFTVTSSTVTYEAGSALQVTIQLNTVDVAATERANGEARGSFLAKANAPAPAVQNEPQPRRRAGRSITNADLEGYRRAREEGDKAYEQRRKELGLPSREERRREVAAIDERTLEQARNMRAQQAIEQEAYWRGVAEAQRAGMAQNQGQPDYSRGFLNDPFFSYGAFGEFPFDGIGFGSIDGRFRRFGRFRASDPFAGFLSTPITPFPRFPSTFRRPIFVAPRTPRTHGRRR